MNPHEVTKAFEDRLCHYTGAPFAVAIDNCSNALFLALYRKDIRGKTVAIPARTYPSVPCEIIHAGGRPEFIPTKGTTLAGAYQLGGTGVFDCALRFTRDMYIGGTTMCLSFTGPHKHLNLGKGGAILTDAFEDYLWYKRARYSGRRECNYHEDMLDMLGWNFYMTPDYALRGLHLMDKFYYNGERRHNLDIELPYPDLSKFPIYTQHEN